MKEKQKKRTEKHGWFVGIVVMTVTIVDTQGCCLRKIVRSRKFPNHEILGAQHITLFLKRVSFSHWPKARVSHLWHPTTSRAQR